MSAWLLPEFPDGGVTYDYREHNYLFPYTTQTCIIFRCLYKNIRSNLLSFCIVDCANCCMYIKKCKIKYMFKSNRVHYFVECFQKISTSGYSSEAYNYYQVIYLLHSITSIIIFNCRALHCTAFVSLPSSRYGLNNVERDVKHQILIISSSISLQISTYIHTHFSYFNAYSVLFGKIKLRFFFYFNPPNLCLCPRRY